MMETYSVTSIFLILGFSIVLINFQIENVNCGILYPQESETREVKSLDGIWNFRLAPKDNSNIGFEEAWFNEPLEQTGNVELMPVPSSYNDITQKKEIRDHIGWVWYDRQFYLSKDWLNRRIFLRFGGINYHAVLWLNGVQIGQHSGGHLPFQVELTSSSSKLLTTTPNRLTVALNNTLTPFTIPQGKIFRPNDPRYPPGYFTLTYDFDFFNYAGIHRSVFLYTTPISYIDDITVGTDVSHDANTGLVNYAIKIHQSVKSVGGIDLAQDNSNLKVTVSLLDKKDRIIDTNEGDYGVFTVPNPNLWWPFTMVKNDEDAGYLHTLEVSMVDSKLDIKDVYRLKIGIRSVKWTNNSFLINHKPFYFRGFGRHEDSDIRGKGLDNVLNVKDHNLVKWTGANSYRTSHYPYSEEIMDLTDRLGIVIIDECPGVSLSGFDTKLLNNHKESIRSMIQRDKNRASVVMWSVANEPQSSDPASESYFNELVKLARLIDPTRPVTIVIAQQFNRDVTAKFVDILCINRYFSWYSDAGHIEVIERSIINDVNNWIQKFNKPLMIAEYGADTIAGIHSSPEFVFSEEYQVQLMREHFKAFDFLRKHTNFIGEHIWNFADFMTAQGITRVMGNRKGIFTRERQPKASAHLLRERYFLLANETDGYPIPEELEHQCPIF